LETTTYDDGFRVRPRRDVPPPDHRHDEEVGGGGDDDSSGVSRDEENAGQRTEEEHERGEEKEDVVGASPKCDFGVGVVFFAPKHLGCAPICLRFPRRSHGDRENNGR